MLNRTKGLKVNTENINGVTGVRDVKKMSRRSVTIVPKNNSSIRRTRGFLMSNDIDANFTTVLNIFLELGYKVFWSPWSEEIKKIVQKYLLDTALVEEGTVDEFMDVFYKKLEEEQKRRTEEAKTSKTITYIAK